MEPTLKAGEQVVILPRTIESVTQGEIIAYEKQGVIEAHRASSVFGKEPFIRTWGDANSTPDRELVSRKNFIGVVTKIK